MKYVTFFDVETTGFDYWNCSIISLACIILEKNPSYKIVGQFLQYSRHESDKHWSKDAEKVHNISPSQSLSFKPQKNLCTELLYFLKDFQSDSLDLPFWYHGKNKFDYKFIEAMMFKQELYWQWNKVFRIQNVDSTHRLAKQNLQLKNYQLSTVCEHLGIELNHHEAMSDANACKEIWLEFQRQGQLFL